MAEAGLVEEDTARGNRRERWWRATHERTGMRAADFIDDPELAAPLDSFLRAIVEQRYEAESRFVSELPQWMDRWYDKAKFMDERLSLTPEEASTMSEEVQEVVARYRRSSRGGDDSVVVHWSAFPRRSQPQEAADNEGESDALSDD